MTPKPALGMRVVFCGSMRKDILWPAATGIAVALAMAAAVWLRGQHGEAENWERCGKRSGRSRRRRIGGATLGKRCWRPGRRKKHATASNRLSSLRRIFHRSG